MKIIIAALAVVAGITSAKAADIGSMKDVDNRDRPMLQSAPVSKSWSGLWIGAHVGYGQGEYDAHRSLNHENGGFEDVEIQTDEPEDDTDVKSSRLVDPNPAAGFDRVLTPWSNAGRSDSFNLESEGVFGGLQANYKFQLGRVIIAPFADVSFGGNKETQKFGGYDVTVIHNGEGPTIGDERTIGEGFGSVSITKKWGWSVGLQGGALVTDTTYVYALGGIAGGKFNIKGSSGIAINDEAAAYGYDNYPGGSYSDDSHEFGYTLGAGVEQKLTDRTSFGVEGRFTSFADIGASGSSTAFCTKCPLEGDQKYFTTKEKVEGDFGEWSIMGRYNVQFGGRD